jgi:hypothetical protein
MKIPAALLLSCLAFLAGTAGAAESAKPSMPDADYCAQRDADPRKCVIQDGPPNRNHIIRKPPPATSSLPPQPVGRKVIPEK